MARALIFAGGTGRRMSTCSKPKQFLELHGKPIIIYTLEHFEYHEEIETITVVCLTDWITELKGLLKRFGITKVTRIVSGGETGHDSIYYGLAAMRDTTKDDEIILIHDGVRPFINEELISRNIKAVKKYGSAITVEAARESIIRCEDGKNVSEVPPRDQMYIAKAPQSFFFGEIFSLYERAQKENVQTIDSSHLCSIYQVPMHVVHSTKNNLKITEPADYYMYRALYEAMENQQIFGL